MNKEQFLNYWSKPDTIDLMNEHLDLLIKDCIEESKSFE